MAARVRVRVRVRHSRSCLKRPADPPGPECVIRLGIDACYTGMPVAGLLGTSDGL